MYVPAHPMHIYARVEKQMHKNLVIYQRDNVNLVLSGMRPQNNTKNKQRRTTGK